MKYLSVNVVFGFDSLEIELCVRRERRDPGSSLPSQKRRTLSDSCVEVLVIVRRVSVCQAVKCVCVCVC